MMSSKDEINLITEKIIGCAYKVANELGCGFLEKVYENALAYEIGKVGLKVDQQKQVKVFYDKIEVRVFTKLILVVQDVVLVEIERCQKFR